MSDKKKYSNPCCDHPECNHIPNEITRAAMEEARLKLNDLPILDVSSPKTMLRSMGIDPETWEDIDV